MMRVKSEPQPIILRPLRPKVSSSSRVAAASALTEPIRVFPLPCARWCGSCGSSVDQSDRYCGGCGYRL